MNWPRIKSAFIAVALAGWAFGAGAPAPAPAAPAAASDDATCMACHGQKPAPAKKGAKGPKAAAVRGRGQVRRLGPRRQRLRQLPRGRGPATAIPGKPVGPVSCASLPRQAGRHLRGQRPRQGPQGRQHRRRPVRRLPRHPRHRQGQRARSPRSTGTTWATPAASATRTGPGVPGEHPRPGHGQRGPGSAHLHRLPLRSPDREPEERQLHEDGRAGLQPLPRLRAHERQVRPARPTGSPPSSRATTAWPPRWAPPPPPTAPAATASTRSCPPPIPSPRSTRPTWSRPARSATPAPTRSSPWARSTRTATTSHRPGRQDQQLGAEHLPLHDRAA